MGRHVALDRGPMLGPSMGQHRFVQHVPVQLGQLAAEPHLPVPVTTPPQPGRRGSVALFLVQQLRLVRLPDLGGHHVQDPLPQDPQRLRVVLGGVPEQRHLRLRADLRVQAIGQRVDRGDDHLRLVHQHLTIGECQPDRLMGLGGQRGSELRDPMRVRAGLLRLVCPPVRRRRGAGLGFHLDGLAVGDDPRLELGVLGAHRGQVLHERGGGRGVHRPGRHVANVFEEIADPSNHVLDRVCPIDRGCGAGHGSIFAPTTDSPKPLRNLLWRDPIRNLTCGRFPRG